MMRSAAHLCNPNELTDVFFGEKIKKNTSMNVHYVCAL